MSWLDPVFVGLGVAGYAGLVWVALALGVAHRRRLGTIRLAAATGIAVWSADLVALGVKAAVGRERPFEALPEVEPLLGGVVGHSFPSGHAATSLAGAVLLGFAAPRALPFLLLLAAAVAFSRLYVGVHYPSDVLGGALLGAAVGLLCVRLLGPLLRPGGAPLRRPPARRRG